MCQHPVRQKWYHNACQDLDENMSDEHVFFASTVKTATQNR